MLQYEKPKYWLRGQKMRLLFILSVILLPDFLPAQEPVSFLNDRFSGISAAPFSPTHPFINENTFDINIISEEIFAQNRHIYISRQSILGIIGADIETANPKKGISGEKSPNILDYFNKEKETFHFSSDVMGPAFSVSPKIGKNKYIFGIFTRLRTQGSGIGLDNYLRFDNSGVDPPQIYELQPFKTNVMNWGELAFHISKNLDLDDTNRLIFGANMKYEIGMDAVVINNKKQSVLRRIPQEDESYHTEISDYDIDAFYATAYDFDKEKYTAKKQGSGFGLDFGIAFLHKNPDSEKYDFKVNLNILDFGYINFQGAQHHLNGANFDFDDFDSDDIENPTDFFHTISQEIYGNPNQSLTGNSLKIGLPTSIHFNAGKRIKENGFLNFDWVQRISFFENSLKRSNISTLSYSVQKQVFGAGISASVYEYEDLRFGGYIRIGPLVLGSENAFPLLFKHKHLHGADFYIAVKLSPFWDNELKRRQRSKCGCD